MVYLFVFISYPIRTGISYDEEHICVQKYFRKIVIPISDIQTFHIYTSMFDFKRKDN